MSMNNKNKISLSIHIKELVCLFINNHLGPKTKFSVKFKIFSFIRLTVVMILEQFLLKLRQFRPLEFEYFMIM